MWDVLGMCWVGMELTEQGLLQSRCRLESVYLTLEEADAMS